MRSLAPWLNRHSFAWAKQDARVERADACADLGSQPSQQKFNVWNTYTNKAHGVPYAARMLFQAL